MQRTVTIGLIGDFDAAIVAHRAIPRALELAALLARLAVAYEWIPTEYIPDPVRVSPFDGLWCVPGSPYRRMEGALDAIRYARENAVPFLGTCGGFQHAVVEYARNVLGWTDAEHSETAPAARRAVITPLRCALIEASESIRLAPGTRIAAAYAANETREEYRCRYGLNPKFRSTLVAGPLRASAEDESGDVRAIELDGHPFFVATLFQPERAALRGDTPPLVAPSCRQALEKSRASNPSCKRLRMIRR